MKLAGIYPISLTLMLVGWTVAAMAQDPSLTLAAVDPGPGPVSEEQIDNLTHRRIVLSSARVLEAMWLRGQRSR
ncbi:MAG: hypothetical protein GY769_04670 [bacterium]|nr:hypothetical protein [bacterium]